MDDKQRQHILKNLDKLIRLTNYDDLMVHCVNNGLLTYIMRQNIENINEDLRDEELQHERHRRLFVKLTKRGPTAYRRLKSMLSGLKCDAAVLLLNEPMHNESQFTPLNPGMYLSRDPALKTQQLIDTTQPYPSTVTLNAANTTTTTTTATTANTTTTTNTTNHINNNNINNNNQNQNNQNSNNNNNSTSHSHAHAHGNPLTEYNARQRLDDTVDECLKHLPQMARDHNGFPLLQQYGEQIHPLDLYEVKKSTKIHTDEKVGCYPMLTENHRGVFFCVNIIDFPNKERRRNGAEEDRKSLLYLFKELGFKLFYYENLRQSEFEHLLDLILHSEHTRDTECFVMALMTHGESTDQDTEIVEFADGAVMKVREIEKRFGNGACAHLLHKPKILIFPFCRGKIKDFGQTHLKQQQQQQRQHKQTQLLKANRSVFQQRGLYAIQTDHISSDNMPKTTPVPTYSDMMISFASLRGYAAHRDPLEGSWYIQTFCQLMAENAHDTSFNNILMMIQTKMLEHSDNGAIQMPSYHNIGFSKMLYLNPGIWLQNVQ